MPTVEPRRITLVTSATAWGGAELQATALARTLVAHGHQVTLVEVGGRWFDHPAVHAVAGLRVVHVPGPRMRGLAPRAALRLLQAHRGDVCVVSKPSFGEGSFGVDLVARTLYPRYVRWEHHPAPWLEPRPRPHMSGAVPHLGLWWHAARLRLHLQARAAHRVITVSDVVRAHLAVLPGYDAARTVRVHCGVDTTVFAPSPERRARSRADFGFSPDDVVVGAIGRVAENKRYDLALRAFHRLVEARPGRRLRFLLAGEGPEGERLRALARQLGVEDQVRFAGPVAHAADALCALDVFVMPSRVEGLGIALLEAMACGCACVAMDSGGPAEILGDPAHGWLVPLDDGEAFASALTAAVDEPPDARQHRARLARAHVERHFTAARQLEVLAHAIVRG